MFILRSAFWLTIGFMIMAPHGTDFGAVATAVKDRALSTVASTGESLVMNRTLGKTYTSTALIDVIPSTPSTVVLPMQDSPAAPTVFPRPRPAAMG